MTKEKAQELLNKYLENKCSPEEKRLVESWYNQAVDSHEPMPDEPDYEQVQKIIYSRLPLPRNIRRINYWPRIASAAAILLFVAIGLYFYTNDHTSSQKPVKAPAKIAAAILPGSNKAILTLGDGSKINLTDATNGELAEQSGTKITKEADGQLSYKTAPSPLERAGGEATIHNTLTVPRGGQYQLQLPDGTKVWLNSASSLRYPSKFSGGERRVELSGEAYFEVAKAPLNPPKGGKSHSSNSLSSGEGREEAWIPFIVVTATQEVEVLGTHFNISAYHDDETTQTTLLEGKVRVSSTNSGFRDIILKPGQAAVTSLRKPGVEITTPDDADDIIAWKNGYFIFNNENIRDIMKKLSRWYNFDVAYQGDMSDIAFQGNYLRSRNLDNLLKTMELTNKIHFKTTPGGIEKGERRITVIANN
ncbi:FecR family protein [Pedobacter sp. BS3]|uniref:FecR family protein n=1 Tax=Pedobacter sp. BS3 TaxID=2567937 RepID=UPI0011EF9D6F|nr:FecR family protein [Pedobacter sp. BS3]TZF84908.1 FecR family protein [Pedobacter sp. BS3]